MTARTVELGPRLTRSEYRQLYVDAADWESASSQEGHAYGCQAYEGMEDNAGIGGTVGRSVVAWFCAPECPLRREAEA